MAEFWIPVSLEEETKEKLNEAISACHRIHAYTIATLNSYFIKNAEAIRYSQFRNYLYWFIREEKLPTQRYSLIKAAEKTFPYFNQNKLLRRGKFIPVTPILRHNFHEIQFEARQVWKKYLVLNDLITTAYGNINLDKSWGNVLEEQADEREIVFESIPLLWHSVTLFLSDKEQKIKFNLHEPDSRFGKESLKKVKELENR